MFQMPVWKFFGASKFLRNTQLSFIFKPFFATVLLEAPVYFFFTRTLKMSIYKKLGCLFVLNVATHPMVYFIIPYFVYLMNGNYGQTVILGELFAPIIESLLLYRWTQFSFWKCSIIAILANLFSWWIGVVLLHS